MANTISSDLYVDVVSQRALNLLPDILAPLRLFTTDFTDEVVAGGYGPNAPLQSVVVPIASGTSAVLRNPTDYEQGDTTLSPVTVEPDVYSKPFHLTDQERNNGIRFKHMIDANLRALANELLDVVFTYITTTGTALPFGTAVVDKAAGSFTGADLQALWAAIEKGTQKNAVLSGPYYSKILPLNLQDFNIRNQSTAGIAGFDNIVHCSRWSAAGTKVAGFAASPEAFAIVNRLPDLGGVEADLRDTTVITLPDLGLSLRWCHWTGGGKSRVEWMSFDTVFGAAVGDATALKIMTNGT